jgi:predicted RNA-binding protein
MLILPKFIYRFKAIPIKILARFFKIENEKIIQNKDGKTKEPEWSKNYEEQEQTC